MQVLYRYAKFVCNRLKLVIFSPICTLKMHSSYRTHYIPTKDAAFDDFLRVEVDGVTLDEANYTVKSGSTVVTLNADYVATLSVAEHTIGIVSQSGTDTAKFTVNKKAAETTTATNKLNTNDNTKSPQTGDTSNLALWWLCSSQAAAQLQRQCLQAKRKSTINKI